MGEFRRRFIAQGKFELWQLHLPTHPEGERAACRLSNQTMGLLLANFS